MKVAAVVIAERSSAPTFAQMMQRLYLERHTGPVLVHFAQGRPNVVEIQAPSTRIALDRRDG